MPLCLALLVCTIPLDAAFAQNASQSGTNVKGSNSSSPAKNQSATTSTNNKSATNKTVVKVAPGSTATITTAGNTTTVTAAASSAASKTSGGGNNNLAFNRTGFTNTYILTINGKIFPVKYDIKGGKLVGMLADTDRSTLVLVLNPGTNGGNMTVELPRNIIDSKGPSNSDTKYQIKIDGKGVDYKEVANNAFARVLSINFSKDNRFMEISGTKIAS